ncbi:cytochrome c [Pseudomonas sp. 008]|uniref:c-type cytochrome n=1 Tax=Pseudomonas sp. 008 TaxID=2803906 RepID=UPI001952752A|nr:c-type cytochrome [Pseudomonas sp. 008]GID03256.1 cytochrome c [Pseudomonas sp. 008]
MKVSISVGLLLLVATVKVWAAETPSTAMLATCAGCHGDQGQGNAALGAPSLAGQHAEYLALQLRNFKAGRRGYDAKDTHGAQMRAMVAQLDEADFERLARHYARLESPQPQVEVGEQAAQGKAFYQGTCASCHGPEGEGFALLKTPNLRILDAPYLDRQLKHYVLGVRGSEAHSDQLGLWMRGISLQIGGDVERKALIDYIGSLSAAASSGDKH